MGIITGPGYQQVDLGLSKEITLFEGFKMGLFALGNNAFNHPSLADPNVTISAPGLVGTITSVMPDQDAPATVTGGNRELELGVRIEF